MLDPVAEQLASLPRLSKPALCDFWKQLFKASPPRQLRRELMVPILAYRLQEMTFGSLSTDTRRRLCQFARALEADPDSAIHSMPAIKRGTRFVREFGGQVHVVTVEVNGYECKGGRYQSLSEIARLITGTRWSGPLFFGLKSKKAKNFKNPEEAA